LLCSCIWLDAHFILLQRYKLILFAMSIMREIVRAFFSKKKKKKKKGMRGGQSEYRNSGMWRKKKITQQLQAIARRAGGILLCEIETTAGYKVTSFDSQYVTFLHARTRFEREWPHYVQLDHQLHTYCQRDVATSRQCWHWYCWKLNILTRGTFRNICRETAGDKAANSLFRTKRWTEIFSQRNLESKTNNERCWWNN